MPAERLMEQVRRDFTAEELAQMHEQLVIKVGEVRALREQKTAATALLNTQIKGSEKDTFDLQSKLETGYELVEVEVLTLFDTPEAGWKRLIRADNNERLRDLPMSPKERQARLFGDDLPEAGPSGQ